MQDLMQNHHSRCLAALVLFGNFSKTGFLALRLPSFLVDKLAVEQLLRTVGTILEVDINSTPPRAKLKMDLKKPFLPGVLLDVRGPKWVQYAYELLPLICYRCGFFGHIVKECTKFLRTDHALQDDEFPDFPYHRLNSRMRDQITLPKNPSIPTTSTSSPQPKASSSKQHSCSTNPGESQHLLQTCNLPPPPISPSTSLHSQHPTQQPLQPPPPQPKPATEPSANPILSQLAKEMTQQGLSWTPVPQNPAAKTTASPSPNTVDSYDKGKDVETQSQEPSIHAARLEKPAGQRNVPTDILITRSQRAQTT
ncbi:branchpoint-bridging protein-like [Papaver somniferum]|uniref:branchpoint-bridging protein-like n=1 Tax=Papaver somniferum TaxID=3469 RepID=UPI000E6F9A6E|nr:branchpoint-bridging protein-like [Papaver somniferum]